MTLKTVPVTGTLYNADGSAAAGASVAATLTTVDTDGGIVVPGSVSTTADASGVFTLNLWPNARGVNGSQYLVRAQMPGALPGVLILNLRITVPDSDPTVPIPVATIANRKGPDALSDAKAAMLAAQASATQAAASQSALSFLYPGVYTVAPTTRPPEGTGAAMQTGDRANFSDGYEYHYTGSAWVSDAKSAAVNATAASASRAQMLYIIQGSFAPGTPPTHRDDGSAVQNGDYASFTDNLFRRYNGETWVASDINTANLAAPTGSSTVGTIQSGSGSIPRDLLARGRDFLNVLDYAVGSGSDETTAIQNALTYARQNNRKMQAQSKLFAHATGLTVDMTTYTDGAFILEGEGYNALPLTGGTCFRYTGTTGSAWSLPGTSANNQDGSFELRSFAVHGSATTSGNSSGAHGINASVLNNALLHDIFSGHHGGHGFYGTKCYTMEFHRGLYYNNFGNGIHLVDSANRVHISHVEAFGNGRDPSTIDQANIFMYGTPGVNYAPIIDHADVSFAGRPLFAWAGGGGEVGNISSVVVSGGTATVTTSVAHGLVTGNKLAVKRANTSSLGTGIYGTSITVTSTTTFTYATGAANGTYTSTTDPTLVIGTHSNGLELVATSGARVNSLYCEQPLGNGIYVANSCDAIAINGGFMLNAQVIIDSATNVEIGGIRFQGADAGVYINEANQRATVNLKKSTCTFASGAAITRPTFYMEDGVRYGPSIPTTGTWTAGEILRNSNFQNGGAVPGWRCTVSGTPGSWVALGQAPAVYENVADAGITLTVGASFPTNIWQSPLTANRTVTLSSSSTFPGAKFRVVRTAAATGAFTLDVSYGGTIKSLSAGQWAEFEWTGSTWLTTAYGSL